MTDVLFWTADFLQSLFESEFIKVIIAYIAVTAGGLFVYRECSGRSIMACLRVPAWRNSFIIMAAGHIVLLWIWKGAGKETVHAALLLFVLFINILLDILLCIWLIRGKSAARKKMERLFKEHRDLLKCHGEWLKIDEKRLAPKDAEYWNRGYYYLLFQMGNIEKSARIAEKTEKEGTAKYLEWQALYEEAKGNIDSSIELTKQALAAVEEKDRRQKAELLNNWGRCMRICGNNKEALKYFNRAADLIPADDDGELVCAVYSNLIFTYCLESGGADMDKIERFIHELESHLDMSDVRDVLEVENIKLELARQQKDKKRIKELIEAGYDSIRSLLREEEDQIRMRLTYEVSTLHVAHMAELNLGKYMDVLEQDFELICSQRMPEKYYFLKEIFILLLDYPVISREFYERYRKLFDYAAAYITGEAQEDMQCYLEDLHEDAIYAYGNTLTEIIWMGKYKGDYNFCKICESIQSICDTYERQGLLMEAMTRRLVMVEEAVTPINIDKNFDLRWGDLLGKNLDKAAEMAENIKLHPGYAGNFFNLAYGYMRIHQYEKGRRFFRKFLDCNLSPEHYTPWTRMNMAFVEVVSNVLDWDEALRKLRDNPIKCRALSSAARKWISGYPENTSEDITLLFGGLLNERPVTAKIMRWNEVSESGIWMPVKHFWLSYAPEGGTAPENFVLELDLKYNEVSDEEDRVADIKAPFGGKRVLYFPDRHPLQTGESSWAGEHVKYIPEALPQLQAVAKEFQTHYENGEMTYLEEIRQCILAVVK